MWDFNKTTEFIKCSDILNLSIEILDAIERWAVSVGRIPTNKQKIYFRSPKNLFEIWVARIPDPDSNKGSSGGFRLVYFLNIKEQTIHIDKIERRDEIGFKKEKTKEKQKFQDYLRDIKKYLLETIEADDKKL